MMGTAFPTLLAFPTERPVFLREISAGMYGAPAYFVSKTLLEVPLIALQAAVALGIPYGTVGLQGSFLVLAGAYLLTGFCAASIAICVGCAVTHAKVALEVAPLLFVPQILFAGFFIKTEQIPKVLHWVQYGCFLKWSVSIGVAHEFEEDSSAAGLLASNDMDP